MLKQETKKQVALKEKRFITWANKLLEKNDMQDLIDVQAEFDAGITLAENKEQFLRKFGLEEKDNTKAKMEQAQAEFEEHLKEQVERFNRLVGKPNTDLEHYFSPIKEAIEQMKMGLCNLVFVKGRGGIGKTEQIERYLLQYFGPKNVVPVTDITEAYLYRLFYKHNGCVFHFRDVDKLLRTERSLLTLKCACETKEKRLLTNYNFNSQNKDLPKQFLFTGKLIFDFNEITNMTNRESFEALISRGEFIHLNFSFDDICNIMKKIAERGFKYDDVKLSADETKEITNWLIKNYKFVGYNQFNLRTQHRAFMWYEYCKRKGFNWQDYIKNKLQYQKSEIQQMLYTFMGDGIVRTIDLKKWLIKMGFVNTLRTADRRIKEWIELDELYKVSGDMRNYYVSLNPLNELANHLSEKEFIKITKKSRATYYNYRAKFRPPLDPQNQQQEGKLEKLSDHNDKVGEENK